MHTGRNVDDAFMAHALEGLDSDASLLSDAAIRLRYQQAIPSTLQGRLLGKTFGSREMTHADRVALIESAKGWAVKVGSESSLTDLVLELREADRYTFGQFAPNTQQDPTFRSMTKPVEIDAATIPADRLASVTTTEVLNAYGGKSPQFHMTVGGVTPQQKSLFGYLPANPAKLRDAGVEAEAVQHIMSDIRTSGSADLRALSNAELRRRAQASWEIMRNQMEANPLKLHAMRKLGSLGEGDFLVAHGLTQMKTKERGVVQIKSLHLDPNKHRFGQTGAAAFGPRDVIGYDASGAAVTSGASENWFTGLTYDAGTEIVSLPLREAGAASDRSQARFQRDQGFGDRTRARRAGDDLRHAQPALRIHRPRPSGDARRCVRQHGLLRRQDQGPRARHGGGCRPGGQPVCAAGLRGR